MPEERSLYLFASVLSAAIFGVEVCPVQVEADVSNGLPSFIMVGFPSAQVKEAQERVRTALKNNGYQFPPKRITVNFAPADMKKEGAGFDVPVAAAVLAAFEMISPQALRDIPTTAPISPSVSSRTQCSIKMLCPGWGKLAKAAATSPSLI